MVPPEVQPTVLLNASSSMPGCPASLARISSTAQAPSEGCGAWCAGSNSTDASHWIMVQFEEYNHVVGVVNQGIKGSRVENFSLAYSVDATSWQNYEYGGSLKVAYFFKYSRFLFFA